ncbi:DNA cytosine methyltransferase [Acidimicrobiia bacterium EGI L10123]|uniref:DNA cytosine methyltransferase n=1 Tax=Salinilacustrithrix flava TaxID=2957203 RepID=UPI003D7C2208|nr:DNA cytosine methyltransferase [Acidimicrobiia bacterium EGI L10123]
MTMKELGRDIRTVDLFAGAGGLSLGFHLADLGFTPVYAVEHDSAAAATFRRNFGCEVFADDIEYGPHYPEAELMIGGPPCQGFSPLGRDRDDESRAQLNGLWKHYLDAVRTLRPKAFVIENVPEFQRSAQFAELLRLLQEDDDLRPYRHAAYGVLNAADYGVPQNRRRGIMVAVRDSEPLPWPPPPTHGAESATGAPHVTVKKAIGDLPSRTKGFDPCISDDGAQHLHFGRRPTAISMERYRTIPPGGNRFDLMALRPDITPACWLNKPTGTTDVMGRMWWEKPSPTIRTEFFKPEKGRYLHPTANRVISHREAARLQSFPDSYVFEGTKIQIARQIGNAVPPLLGKAIAEYVHAHAFK